jgi:hypothetical protein
VAADPTFAYHAIYFSRYANVQANACAARVLDKLSPSEQEAFLKAMDLLETELHPQDTPSASDTQR